MMSCYSQKRNKIDTGKIENQVVTMIQEKTDHLTNREIMKVNGELVLKNREFLNLNLLRNLLKNS